MHARDAAQPIHPLPQTQKGGQKTRRRTCIGNKQFQRFFRRAAIGNHSAQSLDRNGPVAKLMRIRLLAHFEAKCVQAVKHCLRILTPQRAFENDFPLRQCRQYQRAIRNALGTGHGHGRLHRLAERNNFDGFRETHF